MYRVMVKWYYLNTPVFPLYTSKTSLKLTDCSSGSSTAILISLDKLQSGKRYRAPCLYHFILLNFQQLQFLQAELEE